MQPKIYEISCCISNCWHELLHCKIHSDHQHISQVYTCWPSELFMYAVNIHSKKSLLCQFMGTILGLQYVCRGATTLWCWTPQQTHYWLQSRVCFLHVLTSFDFLLISNSSNSFSEIDPTFHLVWRIFLFSDTFSVNPSRNIPWKLVSTMAANAQTPCVTRPSAAVVNIRKKSNPSCPWRWIPNTCAVSVTNYRKWNILSSEYISMLWVDLVMWCRTD